MLDRRSGRLLQTILNICGTDGSYKIIEIRDLVRGMLPKFKVDAGEVYQLVRFLAAGEMIDIKYSDESVHCICVLPKGRVWEESRDAAVTNRAIGKGLAVFIVFGSFVAAFIGSVIAGILLALVGA